MSLPNVAQGDPHVAAHNNERELLNSLQDLSDETFFNTLSTAIEEVGTSVFAAKEAAKNLFTGKAEYNGGFTNVYDTALWIAPSARTNPIINSQGLYVQHRVNGDLGGFVHDAAASELRLNAATNTGAGQSAHESSLVITGGANVIGAMSGSLANFHATGTPSGSITEVALFRATQIPALPGTLTIAKAIGLYVDPQIVGATNFSIYAPDGDSVVGTVRPKDVNTVGLRVKGLAAQVSALFAVANSADASIFSIQANGTVGVGSLISGASLWANNNLTSGASYAFVAKAHAAQSVDVMQARKSDDSVFFAVGSTGNVRIINNSLIIRNAADSGSYMTLGTTGLQWNDAGLQQTTVGAAGAAAALPATPAKYLKVKDSAGTSYVIPAYAAA